MGFRVSLPALIAAGAALAGLGVAWAAEPASAYTRHDFSACAPRPSPHPDVVEVRSCAGYAGIPVVWTGEPDASSVAFGPGPDAGDAPPGLDRFYEARGTIEWRGPRRGGGIAPHAAIVRYDTGPAVGRLRESRLVLYRLVPNGTSCAMGVVKGSTSANAVARALVDRHAAGFVCGQGASVGAPVRAP